MIVQNSRRLHMGIHYYTAQKFKAAFFHIGGDEIGPVRSARHFGTGLPPAGSLLPFGKTANKTMRVV
jgi:hypothetical protein